MIRAIVYMHESIWFDQFKGSYILNVKDGYRFFVVDGIEVRILDENNTFNCSGAFLRTELFPEPETLLFERTPVNYSTGEPFLDSSSPSPSQRAEWRRNDKGFRG